MSVWRGSFLKHILTTSTYKTRNFRLNLTVLLLTASLGALALSIKLNQSGLAALRTVGDKNKTKERVSIKPLPASSNAATNGILTGVPLQGCTVDCSATVPAEGSVNTPVQFLGSANTSGCATTPSYQWNFGDGTARSNEQNPLHTYATPGTFTWTLTTSSSTGQIMIDTIVGGLGEGNPARQAPFGTPIAIARDTQGRGIYVADTIGNQVLIRFINTSSSAVTIAGVLIAPGTVRAIAGGGLDPVTENIPALQADLGRVTGLGVSGSGDLVYFSNQIDDKVRAVNISANNLTVGQTPVGPGRVGTLSTGIASSGFGFGLSGLAVNTTTGDVYVASAAAGVNRVYRITPAGATSIVAGNGANTMAGDPFNPGPATGIPLSQPRSVEIDGSGQLIISDTGHGRVIRVDGGGTASLVFQFSFGPGSPNPFPSGLAVFAGNVYTANGNQQTVTRVGGGSAVVAGSANTICDYTISNCGDGGPGTAAGLNLVGSSGDTPIAGIESDGAGLFILDQGIGVDGKGRVRYLNLSGGPVTVAGVTIQNGSIDTIAGNGQIAPFDGSLATSATLGTPVGVAADANGNLWITDQISARLRFVNRGTSAITIFPNTPSAQTVSPGVIVTVNKDVGTGEPDGGPVSQAAFDSPQGLYITSQGVYIADSKSGPNVPPNQIGTPDTSLIRFINTTSGNVTLFPLAPEPIVVGPGQIKKIAGGSELSGIGDGNFALSAKFIGASDVVVTSNNTIYVADVGQKRVRKIDGNTGVVSSLSSLPASQYTGLGIDSSGRLYIANYDGNTVHQEEPAGSGAFVPIGGHGQLTKPRDVTVGSDGAVYVTISPPALGAGNHQIVRITTGAVQVVAGGARGFAGDGGPASGALIDIAPPNLFVASNPRLEVPETVNIAAGPNNEILFTDTNNNRVRRLSQTLVSCVRTGTITIQGVNPVPQLTSISPNSVFQGGGQFTLTVNGSGFIPASTVRWNGQERATTYMSSMQLTAVIPAADVTNVTTASVTVFTPSPGGGISNSLPFTVSGPNPLPTITSLSPGSASEGGPAFTITVNGTGFVISSEVRFDGQPCATTFGSSTRLTAQVPATAIAAQGTASVTVFNPLPGGGISAPASFTISQGVPGTVTSVSAASYSGVAITANSIVAAFGLNMANGTQGAMTLPLPFNMLGTSVKVRDSAGTERDAPLFFVSPGQINYLVPEGTVLGAATATVFRDNVSAGSGQLQITPVAPGLFSANSDGAGVAAANAIRVVGDSQTTEPVIQPGIFPFVPLAIDLGPDNHQIFLSFFGTGFRSGSGLGGVRVTIGGIDMPVGYAGPQGDFVGLDQLNVGPIPRSLIGSGVVDVLVTVDNIIANRVQVAFK